MTGRSLRSLFFHALLGIACALLTAGCAPLRGPDSPPSARVEKPAPSRAEKPDPQVWARPGIPAISETDSLLAYYQQLRGLSGADLGREHEMVRQAYGRTHSDFNRVRYAMVLSLPNTAFTDDGRALDLLEPVSRNAAGQLNALASLLTAHLQERKRLDANAQGLQQKLDALKSLERSMIERKR
jgi:hypothetical protein